MSGETTTKTPLLDATGYGITKEELSDMFHPDNIAHMQLDTDSEHPVSVSTFTFWRKHGGVKGLAQKLRTDYKKGIEGSQSDLHSRKEKYGSNTKRLPKIRTLCELILENFEDKILQILLLAALVSLIIGIINDGLAHGWVEGTSIFIAIIIIVSVTAGNNYIKEKQFQKLVAKAQEDFVAVFRGQDGNSDTLPSPELVVGDVIEITQGMRVPADCVLISGTDIAADESAMTGEPEASEKAAVDENNYKSNPNPFLLAKTLIESG